MEQHLDFEQPIYTCLEKIEELKKIIPEPENLHEEIAILEKQSKKETKRNQEKRKNAKIGRAHV